MTKAHSLLSLALAALFWLAPLGGQAASPAPSSTPGQTEGAEAAPPAQDPAPADESAATAPDREDSSFAEEIIDAATMEQRLATEEGDILYIDADGQITVYYDVASDKGLRARIAASAPLGATLRLYTNNKATFQQMYKRLQDYQQGSRDLGAYRILTDKELNKVLPNGVIVYRCWFMRVPKEKSSSSGIGIGIGIGIGGHHHDGPYIGIGPWW